MCMKYIEKKDIRFLNTGLVRGNRLDPKEPSYPDGELNEPILDLFNNIEVLRGSLSEIKSNFYTSSFSNSVENTSQSHNRAVIGSKYSSSLGEHSFVMNSKDCIVGSTNSFILNSKSSYVNSRFSDNCFILNSEDSVISNNSKLRRCSITNSENSFIDGIDLINSHISHSKDSSNAGSNSFLAFSNNYRNEQKDCVAIGRDSKLLFSLCTNTGDVKKSGGLELTTSDKLVVKLPFIGKKPKPGVAVIVHEGRVTIPDSNPDKRLLGVVVEDTDSISLNCSEQEGETVSVCVKGIAFLNASVDTDPDLDFWINGQGEATSTKPKSNPHFMPNWHGLGSRKGTKKKGKELRILIAG